MTQRSWQVAAAYGGGIIGAGFASGQEIVQFFVLFGERGTWGLLVAMGLFSWLGAAFLALCQSLATESHRALFAQAASPPVAGLVDFALTTFLLATLSVMFAGGGALAARQWGVADGLGVLGMAVLTLAVVACGVHGMLRITGVLVALLCATMLVVAVLAMGRAPLAGEFPAPPPGPLLPHWLLAAVVYVALNVSLSISFLAGMGRVLRSRQEARRAGLLGGLAVGGLALCVAGAIRAVGPAAVGAEMPMLEAAATVGEWGGPLYGLVLLVALLTTAVALTYGIAQRAAEALGWRPAAVQWLVVVAALPGAQVGFAPLVRTAYPVLGYLGAVVILLLLLNPRLRGQAAPR